MPDSEWEGASQTSVEYLQVHLNKLEFLTCISWYQITVTTITNIATMTNNNTMDNNFVPWLLMMFPLYVLNIILHYSVNTSCTLIKFGKIEFNHVSYLFECLRYFNMESPSFHFLVSSCCCMLPMPLSIRCLLMHCRVIYLLQLKFVMHIYIY